MNRYYSVSEYYIKKYGEKTYKIPVHLPVTCPNRLGGGKGCIFCGEVAAGFELLPSSESVVRQLRKNIDYIGKKYRARSFVAYFQNYSSTFASPERIETWIRAAASVEGVRSVALSTRPDLVPENILQLLVRLKEELGIGVELELGLQSFSEESLRILKRGHTVADFEDAVTRSVAAGIEVTVHLIGNLPWEDAEVFLSAPARLKELGVRQVKVHSLYIVKDTELAEMYEKGEIALISHEEYLDRIVEFVRRLDKGIVVQRLFGRAPEERTIFCNWGMSWRKLKNMFDERMDKNDFYQGEL